MPEQGEQAGPSGLVGVLDRIARGLDGHPALQAGIGGGILIVVLAGVVGGIAADQLWLFVVALVVLMLAGLSSWAVARRFEGVRSESALNVGRDATIGGEGEALQTEGLASGSSKMEIKKKIRIGRDLDVRDNGKLGGESFGPSPERQPETPPTHDAGS